jgi:serine phosphatase RsbU (regulator of sigma subunit)
MSPAEPDCAWLISLPGSPGTLRLQLTPGDGQDILLGRAKDCQLRLPAGSEEVSRRHARFHCQSGRWSIVDLGSRWGTLLNGVAIKPNSPAPLHDGDRVHVNPWTFRFSATPDLPARALTSDDIHVTSVHPLARSSGQTLREDLVNLLVEGSAALQAAGSLQALAAAIADIAARGCGLDAAVVRLPDAGGGVEILASHPRPAGAAPPMRFSRALMAAAARGAVAEYAAGAGVDAGLTIVQSNIVSAICAPLMVDSRVHSLLYVQGTRPPHAAAGGFCQMLARMGGLAMGNLQRMESDRSAADLRNQLEVASFTQRVILPQAPITTGSFACAGRSLPSDGYLAGDFFDFQVLPGGRLAVSLGDVSGHGVRASVLMAVAQGFLHAALSAHGDIARAATELNRFVAARSHLAQYITLWIGILDPAQMTLTYIDAGHGRAYLIQPGGPWQTLDQNSALVIGVDPDSIYQPAILPLAPGRRLLVISDGFIEQPCQNYTPDNAEARFGFDGVRAAVGDAPGGNVLDRLFDAVHHFAGGTKLVDDVTALLAHWS